MTNWSAGVTCRGVDSAKFGNFPPWNEKLATKWLQ
jgi:hypothetical protein